MPAFRAAHSPYEGASGEMTVGDCRCNECYSIHAEFISAFGRWPNMTHQEGQELKERRLDNLRSWERVTRSPYDRT